MEKSKNNCVSLLLTSSPFLRRPVVKPPSASSPLDGNVVMDIEKSIASTADNCLRFLRSLASNANLPLHNLINRCRFSQVEWRNMRKTKALSNHNFAAILPGDSVAGVVVANGIMNFLNIYNALLVVRLVLTWFPNSPPAIVSPLSTLCDPYLNIFRGIIPPLGGTLDLSPILAFTVLNAFTSTAAALPAELPGPVTSQEPHQSHTPFVGGVTTSQKRWITRVHGRKQVKEM